MPGRTSNSRASLRSPVRRRSTTGVPFIPHAQHYARLAENQQGRGLFLAIFCTSLRSDGRPIFSGGAACCETLGEERDDAKKVRAKKLRGYRYAARNRAAKRRSAVYGKPSSTSGLSALISYESTCVNDELIMVESDSTLERRLKLLAFL